MAHQDSPPAGPTGDSPPDREQRDRVADDREMALDAREETLRAQEDVRADREQETRTILDDAAERDQQADARDSIADGRDRAASLHSFLHEDDGSSGMKARRSAGLDRSDSKADRASAADDRSKLTGGTPSDTEAEDPVD
jgi:hypothetical protein